MHRRDFLHPQTLARPLGHLLGAAHELATLAESARATDQPCPDQQLLRVAGRAMATQFEIVQPANAVGGFAAAEAAFAEIDRLEALLTVYRDDSPTVQLNQRAFAEPVPVDPELFALLVLCDRLYRQTGGGFDAATGALIKAWGFYRRQGRVPEETERLQALASSGWQHVCLDHTNRTVRFDQMGVELNFGAIGKGYALDLAAVAMRQAGCQAGLLHAGGSSVLAFGSPADRDGVGWTVGVRHPERLDLRECEVRLDGLALGTSAASFQHFHYNGRKLGHLLDPRTGWPALAVAQVSVIAPTAAEADALSTAFFVLGLDAASAYFEAHPQFGAIVWPSAKARPVLLGLAQDVVSLQPTSRRIAPPAKQEQP